ncbi:MAG: ArsR family transcriptional regulator [Spirochaetia bacterium]|nr:ArsR family transcriptional regulator [Spirochaetia bacterium]
MTPEAKRAFKNTLYESFARVGKALSNGHRIELLELLSQAEKTVEELSKECDLSVANASQHLQTLKGAGVVETRREGTFIFYRLAGPSAFKIWQSLRDFGEAQISDIQKLLKDVKENNGLTEGVDLTALQKKLKNGEVTLLDVRPESEYASGHIQGAVSIPLEKLSKKMVSLPKNQEIVAYCRGPYCVFADQAVTQLQRKGYRAARLSLGVPDWLAAGFAVSKSYPEQKK